jgi:hypothetical protein
MANSESTGLVTVNEVVIRAGIPGMQVLEDTGEHVYPADTSDFVKLLREQGFNVLFEHEKSRRTLVGHKSYEV